MVQELILLFTEMGMISAICLIAGLVFVIVELFLPGFGFFGIAGSILLVLSLIIRAAEGTSGNPVAQFFLMLLLIILFLAFVFILFAIATKKGWLSKTPIIENKSAVPTGITEGTADYSVILGKKGKAFSMLRPSGTAIIDDKKYDVVADGEYIAKGSDIEVIEVEGVRIIVKQI